METAAYNQGYRDGIAGKPWPGLIGKPPSPEEQAYYRGYDAGECDRPTMDELTVDYGMEATDPFGY